MRTKSRIYMLGGVPVGLPYAHLIGPKGKALFVAPYRSSDSGAVTHNNTNLVASDGNPGTEIDRPLKTIERAYELCNGNQGEVIYLIGTHNDAAKVTDDWSATFTWAKNMVHLVGIVPDVAVSQRARIAQLSTATGVSPLLNVTGHGNVFANFQIFQGVADATSLVNVQVTGSRNVFENVHIAGIGNDTMSAAGSASLKLDGASENIFRRCVIGLDTATADSDATELLLDTGASRNLFEDCLFARFIDNAGFATVTVADGTGFDRWLWFRRCIFLTESANDAVQQTSVFDLPAMSQGYILLDNCIAGTSGGAAEWDSNNRGRIYNNAVAAAASAAGGVFTRQ